MKRASQAAENRGVHKKIAMTNEQYHAHDETNRLIAEFMGLETVLRHPRTQEWTQARFDYHNSWNSLMPVIHKINDICDPETGYVVFHLVILPQEIICKSGFFGDTIVSISGGSKIDDAYKVVVETIQWHNKNKKP